MKENTILSICIMVKDEEVNIVRCLESLKPLLAAVAAELIIVDTGSTDNTVNIVKRFTDKVYHHPWNNDFSAMRNITIGYATGEWILIIDADEELEKPEGVIAFLRLKHDQKLGGALLMVKNFAKDSDYVMLMSPRVFRRTPEFRYIGVVHNEPVTEGIFVDSGSFLNHYGYISTDKELMERKFERTGALLRAELAKNPANIYYRFQLANTYAMHGDKAEALREAQRAYYDHWQDDELLKKHIYVFGGILQFSNSNNKFDDEAIRIAKHGISLEEEYIDLYFYLAQIYAKRSEFAEASENYRRFLALADNFANLKVRLNVAINHYTLPYKKEAYYNLAAMEYKNGRYESAGELLEKVLQEDQVDEFYREKYGCYI